MILTMSYDEFKILDNILMQQVYDTKPEVTSLIVKINGKDDIYSYRFEQEHEFWYIVTV